MDIIRHNVDSDGFFETTGSTVEFETSDSGQAAVTVNLRVSDGTVIHYPTGNGLNQIDSSLIPPGRYSVVVTVSAVPFEFGRTHDTRILINQKLAVTAEGTVPEDKDVDQDFTLFFLRVA